MILIFTFLFSSSVEDLYETVNDREIRQVFEGQNRIHLEIKQLHRQLAMILDEQRRYVSIITDEVTKQGAKESGQVSLLLPEFFTPDPHSESQVRLIKKTHFISSRILLLTQMKM